MADPLRALLPELYHPLLPDVFDVLAPTEQKATCASCAMCPPKDAPAPAADVTYFRPDAKCCTYEPRLPSYLVGAILADERPDLAEGRSRIRAKIAARSGTTPQWIAPPAKREVLFGAAWRNAFGRSLVLLCPYFARDSGLCTIWRHREAVCSTFFCKYDAAADGQQFWGSVRALVGYVERVVSLYVTRELLPGYQPQTDSDLTLEELEDRPPSGAPGRAAKRSSISGPTSGCAASIAPDSRRSSPARTTRSEPGRCSRRTKGSRPLPSPLA